MDIKVTQKIIKDMCGTASFKRGEAYYRTHKVMVTDDSMNRCTAVVKGAEDFQVTIEKDETGRIKTACSCPTLGDFSKSCQHVAAVLLAIQERKQQDHSPAVLDGPFSEGEMTEGILSLFHEGRGRKSRHQLHFEKRHVLDIKFSLKPYFFEKGQRLFGVELFIGEMKISPVRLFLQHVKLGRACALSPAVIFDPEEHCFIDEVDAVLHELSHVVLDEMALFETLPHAIGNTARTDVLFIPPSAWRVLLPLLVRLPDIWIEREGQASQRLQLVKGLPPLQFQVGEGDSGYELIVRGFDRLLFFDAYHVVLDGGKIFQLNEEDSERLTELQEMLVAPHMNYVPIPSAQLQIFLNKVVPGLRKMGQVELSKQITEKMMKTPLVAKLFLDRLKNRLLAGLEFHYDHIVIQPLEEMDEQTGPLIIRDDEKEREILDFMEHSGFTRTDGGYFMQNEELEYNFLYYVLPALQPLVQVYATTAVRHRLVKKSAFPKIAVKVKKERTNWLEFTFKMDGISDDQIKELLQALEMKRKYYRLPNDSLLSLETREMEEIRRFLQAGPVQDDNYMTTLDMPIIESLKFLELLEESEVFAPEESFQLFLDQLRRPETLDFEAPHRLKDVLREYQVQGFKWMKALASYGFGGVLADEMGLGKTVQSIAFLLSELTAIRASGQPALIVCPSSLTYNWLHEMLSFAPEIQAIVIDGNLAARKELQRNLKDTDVLITSYPLLRQDLSWYEKQTFHTVFFDEAQAFKNPMTQTARAVKKIKADHRFGLTGTPVENSQEELWSIYHVVFPQLFRGLEEYSYLTRKDISRRVRPFLLRRLKEDVLTELPGKKEALEFSELLPEQKELYAALLAKLQYDTLKHLDKESFRKNRIRILAGLTRLRQICCHPGLFVDGYTGSSAKFEQLLQLLEEARRSGRKVLIFSQFTKMLELIGREIAMKGQAYFYLDGNTPSEERVELCNRFNEGERDVFLISLKAGGTGLNLTGADTVILYDLWWNPAVEEQAAGRAHRMGQKNTVQIIKLIARGTIEEKMNELQEKKRDLITDILEFEENAPTTLTEDDIREILMI